MDSYGLQGNKPLESFVVCVQWNCYVFILVHCNFKSLKHPLIHHQAWQPLCIHVKGGCQGADTNPNTCLL